MAHVTASVNDVHRSDGSGAKAVHAVAGVTLRVAPGGHRRTVSVLPKP